MVGLFHVNSAAFSFKFFQGVVFFRSKNLNFSDDFPVIFWYIHIILLH